MNVQPLERAQARRIAEIHAEALKGDFLPSLGVRFLTELYRGMLDLGLGFGFVAVESGRVVGFVIASEDTSRLFRSVMLRRALPLGWHILPALVRRPALLGNVLQTLSYTRQEEAVTVTAELLVIAVDPEQRSHGLGAALCRALEQEFRRRGRGQYKVTVNQGYDGANRFYRRQGFALAHSFRLYGRLWNLYTRTLTS